MTRRYTTEQERTDREVTILRYISYGATNRQIADRVGCTEEHVKALLKPLREKYGARDRAGLVMAAYRAGDLDPTWPPPEGFDDLPVEGEEAA